MKQFLKTFSLPVAIIVGTLAYMLFYYVPALDSVGDVMYRVIPDSLPVMMSLILFGTFPKLN